MNNEGERAEEKYSATFLYNATHGVVRELPEFLLYDRRDVGPSSVDPRRLLAGSR